MIRNPALIVALMLTTVQFGSLSETIVFAGSGHRGPESHGIFLSDAPFRASRPIYEPQPNESVRSPAVSPDGTEIVFVVARGNRNALYRMSIDGGKPTLLTDDAPLILEVDWTPDGQRIVFDLHDGNRPSRIIRINRDGTDEFVYPERGRHPAVSPDGTRIAYARSEPEEGIRAMDIDGGNDRLLTETGILPSWHPDGSRLAFVVLSREENSIYLFQLATGEVRRLDLNEPFGGYASGRPDWSDDGRTLVATDWKDPHPIVMIDMETGEIM
ncbi:MAG: hypothetical protein O3A46_15765, partial [Candidatus Poribacteria bacterium]|nr:hypothetical protein [Candidatus Poribacteria bacterium]